MRLDCVVQKFCTGSVEDARLLEVKIAVRRKRTLRHTVHDAQRGTGELHFLFSQCFGRSFGQRGARLEEDPGDAGVELVVSALPMNFDTPYFDALRLIDGMQCLFWGNRVLYM